MWKVVIFQIYLVFVVVDKCSSISSPITPFINYEHSTVLQQNVADLWWTVDETKQEVTFELHMNSLGWIALGISPAGGMKGADIAIGWVDSAGKVIIQDRHATGRSKPIIDNTSQDWFALKGREQDGWTAIQFKRLLDTCDSMDYPIKSGTNYLIFAYGLVDPDPSRPDGDITYHENRRGSRTIPLRSYGDPPAKEKFTGLTTFEWRLNNYVVPPNDTTYHCKIYKAPSGLTKKQHAIAYEMLLEPSNVDLVHHFLMYECDPSVVFDDNNLPDDICDNIYSQLSSCASNMAIGWAVGGESIVEFPEQAGYPLGQGARVKYFLVQMHYDNPKLVANRRDSSGIRFYIGDELREHDLAFLTFGTDSSSMGLALPPQVDKFVVDSYCSSTATQKFPKSGITVTSAFPHTHLQGISVWTKLIRNKTAVQYLFNGDMFDFNYQFSNRLPEPIKLYPGDEFATRCVYQTKNKNEITVGGEKTKQEMCLHMFTYYPRMDDMYACITLNHPTAWQTLMNVSEPVKYDELKNWLTDIKWTPESAIQWQEFYNNASRLLIYGKGGRQAQFETFEKLPTYKDLPSEVCRKSKGHQQTYGLVLILISFIIKAL